MLWFCMMLMPTGPPALVLMALADVNGSSESEKLSIAKFLTVSPLFQTVIFRYLSTFTGDLPLL